MLAQDIRWIDSPSNVMKPDDPSSNRCSSLVIRQGVVSLVQPGMWHGRSVDDRLVVTEHPRGPRNGDTQVPQRQT